MLRSALLSAAASVVLLLTTTPQLTAAQCSTFTPAKNSSSAANPYTYEDTSQTQRISTALTCHQKPTCGITGAGFLTAQGFTNLTAPPHTVPDDDSWLYTLAGATIPSYLNGSLYRGNLRKDVGGCSGPLDVFSEGFQGVDDGQSGYLTFVPLLLCINGTLSDCSGSAEAIDGTGVQVCGAFPILEAGLDGVEVPNGHDVVVKVDNGAVGGLSSNPALAINSTCTQLLQQESAANAVGMSRAGMVVAVAVGVAFACLF